MISILRSMVEKAPPSVVDAAKMAYDFVPPRLKYGKAYGDALQLLQKSRSWSAEALREYQEALLKDLVAHAALHVPYYREIFRERGLSSKDIRSADDLARLPYLTREIVRERKDDLLAENAPRWDRLPAHTGGSTGSPLDFYMSRATQGIERALAFSHLLGLGYRPGETIAVIRGDTFADRRKRYRYFPGSGQLIFSFQDLDEAALSDVVDVLTRFRPSVVRGFPSTLHILCNWMELRGREIPRPKYVVTSSEVLSDSLRNTIQRVLKAKVADWYGLNEMTVAAGQYSCTRCYHVHGELGIMELIPSQGDTFEIVGTGLHNFTMPLLRYRTGDLAEISNGCPVCGSPHQRITGLVGRNGDMVLTPERRIISPSLIDYSFNNLPEIREGQIVQEDLKTIRVKVVPWDRLSDATRDRLITEIESYLQSPTMTVSIEIVDHIPQTLAGKRPIVVSRLRMEDVL